MKTVVVANQKGGVGKSTLSAHLAYAAISKKLRVLIADMDPQGSLSSTFPSGDGVAGALVAAGLYEEDIGDKKPEILGPYHSIIRSTDELSNIDLTGIMKVLNPRDSLALFADDFDLCIIDTPPTLGSQLVASLVAADAVVTPVSMGKYEMAGVEKLIATIMGVKKKFNRTLKYLGVLPMKTNNRSRAELLQLQALKEQVGDGMLQTHLPERAAVRAAVLAGLPVWEKIQGESHGKAAAEWKAACNLIIKKAME